jgi:hypothetical protein
MARAAVLARLMTDGTGDFQHLERFKGELTVMALGVGEASDSVGNGLVDGFAYGNYLHDMLMDMVIRHGILSSPTVGAGIMQSAYGLALT